MHILILYWSPGSTAQGSKVFLEAGGEGKPLWVPASAEGVTWSLHSCAWLSSAFQGTVELGCVLVKWGK